MAKYDNMDFKSMARIMDAKKGINMIPQPKRQKLPRLYDYDKVEYDAEKERKRAEELSARAKEALEEKRQKIAQYNEQQKQMINQAIIDKKNRFLQDIAEGQGRRQQEVSFQKFVTYDPAPEVQQAAPVEEKEPEANYLSNRGEWVFLPTQPYRILEDILDKHERES